MILQVLLDLVQQYNQLKQGDCNNKEYKIEDHIRGWAWLPSEFCGQVSTGK